MQIATNNINLRLSNELLAYLEEYQQRHGLPTRTEVIIRAIRTLRAQELIEGYQALDHEYQYQPDPLGQHPSKDGLLPSDEESW